MLTPTQLEEKIITIAGNLDQSSRALARTENQLAEAEITFKTAFDKALLASEQSSMERREADARQQSLDKWGTFITLKAKRDSLKGFGSQQADAMNGYQSVLKQLVAELSAPIGGHQ